ncbi:hypothetical protein GW17_00000980 [Ensete ventricosum]|nr:hypothetical protein GW17_00000980 [Ensete ventricosum]
MDESDFHRNMQLARLASEITVNEPSGTVQLSEGGPPIVRNKDIYVDGNRYPFMEAEARDLRLEDVQQLLGLYRQVVTKYRMLSEALRQLSVDENQLLHVLNNHQCQDVKEKIKQQLEQGKNGSKHICFFLSFFLFLVDYVWCQLFTAAGNSGGTK